MPRSFSTLSYRNLTFVFSVADPPDHRVSFLNLSPKGTPTPTPTPKWKSILNCFGELPRSFSALSYRDLTFVFSLAGGLAVAAGIGTGIGVGLHRHNNHTRRDFGSESEGSNYVPSLPVSKREPLSKDEASDSLSSPLKREPEPAPPSL